MNTENWPPMPSEKWEDSAFRHIYFEKANSPYISHAVILRNEYAMPNLLEYAHNSHNFRSKEFHEETEIVALGCSYTFGVGVPEKFIWPTFVKELTGIDDVVNLGKPGVSIAFQVRLLSTYIRNYGPPKIVLCNFPDFLRYEYVADSGKIIDGSTHRGLGDNSYTEEQAASQSVIALGTLEAICKANNITLRWQFWFDISESTEHRLDIHFSNHVHNKYKTHQFQFFNPYLDSSTDEICGENLQYICPDDCCIELKNRSNGCFNYGYDRYSVPKKYQRHGVLIEEEELERLKKSTLRIEDNRAMAHFGSHAHWHWAKNLVDSL
jgi:Pyruvate/2-oxoacid:ferredoxin oxidoreductase delta subunit